MQQQQPRKSGVPQSLCNDNWLGFPLDALYVEKVRWIELAVASPVWTSMVSFYLEGDRGHLIEEEAHRATNRVAIRGNVSSFALPWTETISKLAASHAPEVLTLPHPPEMVNDFVTITVRGKRFDQVVDWVKGATIRPHVALSLLKHLVDIGHPMCRDQDPDALKAQLERNLRRNYPDETWTPEIKYADEPGKKKTELLFGQQKAATPFDADMTEHCAECFTAPMRPNVLSEDHTSSQVPDHAAQGAVNLAYVHPVRHDMEVTTGSAFLDPWQNAFFATAFPFQFASTIGRPRLSRQGKTTALGGRASFRPAPLAARLDTPNRKLHSQLLGLSAGDPPHSV